MAPWAPDAVGAMARLLALLLALLLPLRPAGSAQPPPLRSGSSLLALQPAPDGRVASLNATHAADATPMLLAHAPWAPRLGDMSLHVRELGRLEWSTCTTVGQPGAPSGQMQHQPYRYALQLGGACASKSNALGNGLQSSVSYGFEDDSYTLFVRYRVANNGSAPIEVGSVAFPLPIANDATRLRGAALMRRVYVLSPFIGGSHGYVVANRLDGRHAIAVTGGATTGPPAAQTGPLTRLEAWRPLDEYGITRPRSFTFQGAYEWVAHSRGWQETDWGTGGEPWLAPSSFVLPGGEAATWTLRLHRADAANQRGLPVPACIPNSVALRAIPGTTIPRDIASARLFVYKPVARTVRSIHVHPPGSLLAFIERTAYGTGAESWCGASEPAPRDVVAIRVYGKLVGRARLVVHFDDGSDVVASYFVTPPFSLAYSRALRALGTFMWLHEPNDPFARRSGVQLYDRGLRRHVMQSSRSFAVGLSDDGALSGVAALGVAAALGAPYVSPRFAVKRLDGYIENTLLGGLQDKDTHAVRASLFYQPGAPGVEYQYNATGWKTWSEERSREKWRSFNYPWVAAVYWSLARLARDAPASGAAHPPRWYLTHAVATVRAMREYGGPQCELKDDPSRRNLCNMQAKSNPGASLWVELIEDLQAAGMHEEAAAVRTTVLERLAGWESSAYAFTSEFGFDTVSPEETISWALYFGIRTPGDKRDTLVQRATSFVLTYTQEVSHWAYSGSSLGYWDFDMLGKIGAHYRTGEVTSAECMGESQVDCVMERGLQHYRSVLNAHALLESFYADPQALHLLRTAIGGLTGPLASVDENGGHSIAFHESPRILEWDDFSGDSGVSWFYVARTSASFVVRDVELGVWLCYLCDFLDGDNDGVLHRLPAELTPVLSWAPRDAMHIRTYVAPARAAFEVRDGATIVRASVDLASRKGLLHVRRASPGAPLTVLVSAWAPGGGGAAAVHVGDACPCARPSGKGKARCACSVAAPAPGALETPVGFRW